MQIFFLHFNNTLKAQHHQRKPAKILKFIENKNQWANDVKYRLDLPAGFLFLKNNSLQYSFYDIETYTHWAGHDHAEHKRHKKEKPDRLQAHSFVVNFENANANPIIKGKKAYTTKYNYFLGNNPNQWGRNAKAVAEVEYENLYDDIDLRIYEKNKSLKYEFILAPHAEPSEILMKYEYADSLKIEGGNLVIYTSVNSIIETKPYSYQFINGKKVEVPSKFVLQNNQISFTFPKGYNPNYALVIDPELVFSTYSGSVTDNWGFTATSDNQGNVFSGGIVFGGNFPTTTGAFSIDFNGGAVDIGILKYDANTGDLIYATFLGGLNSETPHSMVANSNDELLILGATGSDNFPMLGNSYNASFAGGSNVTTGANITYSDGTDFFITKLSADGSSLTGATYVGGSGNDALNLATTFDASIKNYGDDFRGDIFVDSNDDVYVAAVTQSNDFPTLNAFQTTRNGQQDAVIFKLNSGLNNLLWSSYLGGSGFEGAGSIRINSSNELYICGFTTSTNLATTTGVINPNFLGSDDGFVAKITSIGTLQAMTYLGTNQADQAFLLDLDQNENVFVMGQTLGTYPVSSGVYNNAGSKQFIQKLDANLTTSLLSTVIGSGRNVPDIVPTAFLVNDCNNIYICGWGGVTNDNGFINGSSTVGLPLQDAFQSNTDGSDFYIMILEEDFNSLIYGSYFGSLSSNDHVDGGTSRFDKNGGIIYQSVCASCGGDTNGFPTTGNAWSNVDNSSNCNNAVFKFDLDGLIADFQIFDVPIENIVSDGCLPFEGNFVFGGSGADSYTWEIEGIGIIDDTDIVPFSYTTVGEYEIKLTVRNSTNCLGEKTITKTIKVSDLSLDISNDTTICANNPIQLETNAVSALSEPVTYTWTPPTGLDNPNTSNPIATPSTTTTYTVVASDGLCTKEEEITVEVIEQPSLDVNLDVFSECGQKSVVNFNVNVENVTGITWIMGNGDTLRTISPEPYFYENPGTYDVTIILEQGICSDTLQQTVLIEDNSGLYPNVITADKNQLFVLPQDNRKLQIYDRWGTLVFETDNYQHDWGKDAKPTTYYYIMTSPSGVECRGWIQVLK